MQKEKVRVYALARELNMESKDLLDLCRQAGLDVKNQLSSLDPEQRDAVELLVKQGGGTNVALAPPPPKAPVIPTTLSNKVRSLDSRPGRTQQAPPSRSVDVPEVVAPPQPVDSPKIAEVVEPPPRVEPVHTPPPLTPLEPAVAPLVAAKLAEAVVPAGPVEPVIPRPEEISLRPPEAPPGASRPPTTSSPQTGKVPDLNTKVPQIPGGRVPDLSQRPPGTSGRTRTRKMTPTVLRVTQPPLKARPAEEKKKPAEPAAQKPIAVVPTEMLHGGSGVSGHDIVNKVLQGNVPVAPTTEVEEEDADGRKTGKVRPGGVVGRDSRHQQRNQRAKERKERQDAVLRGGVVVLPAEEERPRSLKNWRKAPKKPLTPTQPRKGRVPVTLPITVRALCEAIGVRSKDVLSRLMTMGQMVTINSNLDPELAEALALEMGCELEIKRPMDAEEGLLSTYQVPDDPSALVYRAPIVTIMGHVDHGKTSLLDRIRKSNVAATEAGGITQVIRAWRVDHGGRPVTFLDTPGHEAFTKMRARGAQVTDIAVIVVAADDGVMPQTEEAINHAKAAGVPIVVAINKVDMPNANLNKTRQQLYSLNLLPDNMGGDIPFVETSAVTGVGLDLLLENLSIVAEIKELKANPNKPGSGTVLEAMLSEGEGVRATLIVQDGTLRKGDVILCGAAYGRVRQLYDDLGHPIQEAGPSVPVRITGLDQVPNADDPFLVVPDLAVAREIAEKRKSKEQEAALVKRDPVRLEKISDAKIAELKVILKADFRGSIEAIRKELEKLHHEEVRVRLLHAAIGGITESDVQLALTSPEDTIIVGFNVVPDDRARSLAEERGIQIRQYDIIYNLTDDIRSALEGKLKPREEVVFLGRANVRETFKISRVGTIAGCYVTQGTMERSAKIRVIRDGVVIYPPPDRTVGLESLKRFKEDAREVREGFECGLKIHGFDDIKVGDSIEAYRVEQIQRTL